MWKTKRKWRTQQTNYNNLFLKKSASSFIITFKCLIEEPMILITCSLISFRSGSIEEKNRNNWKRRHGEGFNKVLLTIVEETWKSLARMYLTFHFCLSNIFYTNFQIYFRPKRNLNTHLFVLILCWYYFDCSHYYFVQYSEWNLYSCYRHCYLSTIEHHLMLLMKFLHPINKSKDIIVFPWR